MYGRILGASTGVGTAAVATILPNTGSNMVIDVAISVAAGLAVWGFLSRR